MMRQNKLGKNYHKVDHGSEISSVAFSYGLVVPELNNSIIVHVLQELLISRGAYTDTGTCKVPTKICVECLLTVLGAIPHIHLPVRCLFQLGIECSDVILMMLIPFRDLPLPAPVQSTWSTNETLVTTLIHKKIG